MAPTGYSDSNRPSLVPNWTKAREDRFTEIIHNLDDPSVNMKVTNGPQSHGPVGGVCVSGCRTGDHSHAQVKVGPYVICRCLQCPDLVV